MESLKLKKACTPSVVSRKEKLGIKPLRETYKGEEASPQTIEETED